MNGGLGVDMVVEFFGMRFAAGPLAHAVAAGMATFLVVIAIAVLVYALSLGKSGSTEARQMKRAIRRRDEALQRSRRKPHGRS